MSRELIISVLAGEASAEEIRRLREWRAADPANDQEYRQLERLWRASGEWADPGVEAPVPRANEIIARAERRTVAPNPGPEEAGRSTAAPTDRGDWGSWKAAAIAACLVVGIGAGALLFNTREQGPYGPTTFATASGEVATTTLQDGTVVHLAPDSRLELPAEPAGREVTLEGRAYFAVPRDDRGRPFRVRLPDGEVEVLGTRFDAEARNGELQVTVVEGEVRVAASGEDVNVGARQMARSVDAGRPEVEEVPDVHGAIDWLDAFLAFQSTPVEDVIEETERRFGLSVEIEDEALLDRTVTGWFAHQDRSEMIASICLAVDAHCTVDADETVRMELPLEGAGP